MKRSSSLVILGMATTVSVTPTVAAAQANDSMNDPMGSVLDIMANDPFLFLAFFLTAVLILGKGLDLIRSFRDRRQQPIEVLKDEASH